MPRYFFHVRQGGKLIEDEKGRLLKDTSAAELEAIGIAQSMLRAAIGGTSIPSEQTIVVADEAGATVAKVPVTRPLV